MIASSSHLQLFRGLIYFFLPYLLTWLALWVSAPPFLWYRKFLLSRLKKEIERSVDIGDEEPDGNWVLKYQMLTVRYAVQTDPDTSVQTVRILSVKEKLSSPEKALQDLNTFFFSCLSFIQARFTHRNMSRDRF